MIYILNSTLKVEIPAPNIQQLPITIVGLTPLLFHRWDEKAKLMLLKIQQKDPNAKVRKIRDPQDEYLRSFYRDSEGYIAWPVLNIKQAMVDAARNIEGVSMTLLRGSIFTIGDINGYVRVLVNGQPVKVTEQPVMVPEEERDNRIIGHDPKTPDIKIVEDLVRVGMGSADLRYRGEIQEWSIPFSIRWNNDLFTANQVANLLNTAGFACGLGEWRPQTSGDHGTFVVKIDQKKTE